MSLLCCTLLAMPPSWLFFISLLSSLTLFTHSYTHCLHHQKSLLLQLKSELIFDSSFSEKLVQWNETDECCKWHGVECDRGGHVISLQLDDEAISGGIGNSSSLFRFQYLEKLNLAYNWFSHSHIPRWIHNLTSLTHLNLSYAGFSGQVPVEISSLRKLLSLDISNNYMAATPLFLEDPNLEMFLQNLTGLKELYLDGVNISSDQSIKWSHIISSALPNLTGLSLCSTFVSGPLVRSFWQLPLTILQLDHSDLSTADPSYFANFTSLTILSLHNCSLKGYFPEVIFQLPNLQILDLSENDELSGTIPPFNPNGSLKSIILLFSNFSGSIPTSIGNLKTLSLIDLSGCRFTGPIPSTFSNLTQLVYVYLSNNFFTGSLPSSLSGLSSLWELWLNYNQFSGLVDEFSIVNASNIVTLDLSGNQLEGPIPDSLFQLHSLRTLSLSDNLFNGTFQLEKIQSFVNLTSLDLSGNKLSVHVGGNLNSSSYVLPKLQELSLASCDMHDFPDFIKLIPGMRYLDLSNNRIVGEIPSWIWDTQLHILNLSVNHFSNLQKPYHIPASLQVLDLHSNQLHGDLHLHIPPRIGNLMSDLQFLSLANNSLSGSIPNSLCNAESLQFLDLSVNKLSGNIPPCLHENLDWLQVFNLRRNNISGHIPDNLPQDCHLQIFDLSYNTIEGNIPNSLKNCKSLELINVENNIIHDTFPCMLSSNLCVLVLHSNRFHGEVRCQQSWPYLQILDISSNNFNGSLESINISSWTTMIHQSDPDSGLDILGYEINSRYWSAAVGITMKGLQLELVKIWPYFTSIDFSCNNFGGEIPAAIGDLRLLYLLNLSHNAFNSTIPKTLGSLSNLGSLDISVNQLKGTIPEELARLTFLSFLNVSYNKLVGKIPNGPQFQTFQADSFLGNPGLYGFPLNISRRNNDSSPPEHKKEAIRKREIKWEYVCAAVGYVVGLGSIVWVLVFCRSLREEYFDKIEDVVEERLYGISKRRRRARRIVRTHGTRS